MYCYHENIQDTIRRVVLFILNKNTRGWGGGEVQNIIAIIFRPAPLCILSMSVAYHGSNSFFISFEMYIKIKVLSFFHIVTVPDILMVGLQRGVCVCVIIVVELCSFSDFAIITIGEPCPHNIKRIP